MRTIMWAEQKPDLYDGPDCNQIRHRFECFCEGDMESEFLDSIDLNASTFPPGTKVIVQIPTCPKCGMDCEMCQADDLCDFDWDSWVADKYQ